VTAEWRRAYSRDLQRWNGTDQPVSATRALKQLLGSPGVQAVALLRLQAGLEAAGHRQLAKVASLINLRLTGAEFLVGCRIDGGLVVRHPQGIVIGSGAVLGSDCTILHRVTLGERYGDGSDAAHAYPRVGSRVSIGAGAAVLGGVRIGDDATVGANAVVTRDVSDGDVVAGIPARSIRRQDRQPGGEDSTRSSKSANG
jgi:serine O-acetyltransferase